MLSAGVAFFTSIIIYISLLASFIASQKSPKVLCEALRIFRCPLLFSLLAIILEAVMLCAPLWVLWLRCVAVISFVLGSSTFVIGLFESARYLDLREKRIHEIYKECPNCRAFIEKAAKVCQYCGHKFSAKL